MRRFIVGGLVSSAILLGTSATSGAEPTNGEVFTATCGKVTVTVHNSPGYGNKTWVSDGTTQHVKSFEVRIYRGEFTTEPEVEPVFEFSQTFGNRTGQGETLECSVVTYNPDHNATAFEYTTVTTSDQLTRRHRGGRTQPIQTSRWHVANGPRDSSELEPIHVGCAVLDQQPGADASPGAQLEVEAHHHPPVGQGVAEPTGGASSGTSIGSPLCALATDGQDERHQRARSSPH